MAVRVRYKLDTSVSSSSAEERNLANTSFSVVNDALGEGGSWMTTLAGAATDQQLFIPNIADVKLLVVRTTSKDPTLPLPSVTIKKNSALGEAITLVPLSGSKEALFMITTSGLTSLFATNGSATTVVNVLVIASGD